MRVAHILTVCPSNRLCLFAHTTVLLTLLLISTSKTHLRLCFDAVPIQSGKYLKCCGFETCDDCTDLWFKSETGCPGCRAEATLEDAVEKEKAYEQVVIAEETISAHASAASLRSDDAADHRVVEHETQQPLLDTELDVVVTSVPLVEPVTDLINDSGTTRGEDTFHGDTHRAFAARQTENDSAASFSTSTSIALALRDAHASLTKATELWSTHYGSTDTNNLKQLEQKIETLADENEKLNALLVAQDAEIVALRRGNAAGTSAIINQSGDSRTMGDSTTENRVHSATGNEKYSSTSTRATNEPIDDDSVATRVWRRSQDSSNVISKPVHSHQQPVHGIATSFAQARDRGVHTTVTLVDPLCLASPLCRHHGHDVWHLSHTMCLASRARLTATRRQGTFHFSKADAQCGAVLRCGRSPPGHADRNRTGRRVPAEVSNVIPF
ncbi:hypothetical protein N8152_02065 [bacterium]|nr:hypothetical protein [bacterium]